MAKETAELAHYAASCRYEDIPPDVIERAKQCIIDTIAAVVFGYHLPWSRIVVAFAQNMRRRQPWPMARSRTPSRWII